MKIPGPMYKALSMCKNLDFRFTNERLILFLPLILSFKTGGSRARVNHAREHVYMQLQELIHFFSITILLPSPSPPGASLSS